MTTSSTTAPSAGPRLSVGIPDSIQYRALWAPSVGALLGLAWFLYWGGSRAIDPTNLNWIIGDHAQHLLGWLFFRNEPWTLPLGAIPSLPHPLGTTVGFTDANPWVSVLLKPFSPWLPRDFQFIGPWLALCFALQGFLGVKIMETLTPGRLQQLCGAALFVMAPPLLQRIGHDTLAAHWLLLGLIWLHLRHHGSPGSTLAWAFAFNFIAAGVHPYLAMMLIPLTLALLFRMSVDLRQLRRRTAVALAVALLVQTLAIFLLLGYLGASEELSGAGFGIYSADLLTFFNSMEYSRWLPSFEVGVGQYEGFGYLGSGVLMLALVLAAIAAARRYRPQIPRPALPLVIAATLVGIFALSNYITIAGEVVITARSFYEPLAPLVEPARSSGRFIWPLHYVVLTGLLALAVRATLVRPVVTVALLLAAVAMQAGEVMPHSRFVYQRWPRVQSPVWARVPTTYRHLILYPAYYAFGPAACQTAPFTYSQIVQLSDFAYRKRMTFNSAYVARVSESRLESYCQQLNADVGAGRLVPDALYVVAPEALDHFTRPGVGATCSIIEGYHLCASNAMGGRFRERLLNGSEGTPAH